MRFSTSEVFEEIDSIEDEIYHALEETDPLVLLSGGIPFRSPFLNERERVNSIF